MGDVSAASKWQHVDSAKYANVYTDRLKVQGGYLYLVTKMINPSRPSYGAMPYCMTFVPSTYREVKKGIVVEKVR